MNPACRPLNWSLQATAITPSSTVHRATLTRRASVGATRTRTSTTSGTRASTGTTDFSEHNHEEPFGHSYAIALSLSISMSCYLVICLLGTLRPVAISCLVPSYAILESSRPYLYLDCCHRTRLIIGVSLYLSPFVRASLILGLTGIVRVFPVRWSHSCLPLASSR